MLFARQRRSGCALLSPACRAFPTAAFSLSFCCCFPLTVSSCFSTPLLAHHHARLRRLGTSGVMAPPRANVDSVLPLGHNVTGLFVCSSFSPFFKGSACSASTSLSPSPRVRVGEPEGGVMQKKSLPTGMCWAAGARSRCSVLFFELRRKCPRVMQTDSACPLFSPPPSYLCHQAEVLVCSSLLSRAPYLVSAVVWLFPFCCVGCCHVKCPYNSANTRRDVLSCLLGT